MSDGGSVTSTGLEEMRAACHRLPAAVTAACRAVAERSAKRVQAYAKEILRAEMKSDRTALIDAIVIIEDTGNKDFSVVSNPPRGQPKNVTLWNEYGALGRLTARHYMHEAADRETDQYHKDLDAASFAAVAQLLA